MSAYVVDKQHIDFLIRAGLEGVPQHGVLVWWFGPDHESRGELRRDTANAVGRMLWLENIQSVQYRYGGAGGSRSRVDDESGNELDAALGYYSYGGDSPYDSNPVKVLKAIACLEYQSCEHPDWHKSEAAAFCNALRLRMIHRLPGYDDAPWEIHDATEGR